MLEHIHEMFKGMGSPDYADIGWTRGEKRIVFTFEGEIVRYVWSNGEDIKGSGEFKISDKLPLHVEYLTKKISGSKGSV